MDGFLQIAKSFISGKNHPVCDQVTRYLELVDTASSSHGLIMPDQTPQACRYLDQTLSDQNADDFCTDITLIHNQLSWAEAPRGKISSFMDDNHAMVQIIGPDHGFTSQKLRFGIFLLAPNTTYPLHSHAAEEIYIPLSGSGLWRLNKMPYELKENGTIVHCQSWIPHALKSGEKPLLMLWAWIGNISFDAYRIEPNAFDKNGLPV